MTKNYAARLIAQLVFATGFMLIAGVLFAAPKTAKSTNVTPAEALTLLPGFKAELLHVATTNEGSWICLTIDDKGRLILSPQKDDQPLLRVTLNRAGQVDKIETIPAPVRQAMGLCYAHDSLYVNGHGPEGTGLYRLIDSNHNDRFDTNEVHFLKTFAGEGEHGYHGVVAGPDGMIYVINGNMTKLPAGISTNSPHKNFQEDMLLPRLWDANGHAVGIFAPGSHILRTDPEGKKWELLLAGFRNAYDFAFSPSGEIFTFDSDMEWDWGTPWYRPTRIIHAVVGGDYGWRSGAGNWPDYYADSLPATVNIGLGSPTGMKFGTKSNFPKKYRDALYAMDWSYGRMVAVHLQPHGASYTAETEEFVKGKPLNLTDLEFGRDGAMYFITGGRDTQSGLYHVSYDKKAAEKTASASTTKAEPTKAELKTAAKANALRHKLESFYGKKDPRAIDLAWPSLASEDRFLRYAARIAIEWQDVGLWRQRALSEMNTQAGLTALLALARCGGHETQNDLLLALKKFPFASLTEAQQLEKLRIVQLSFIRQGRPAPEMAQLALEKLSAQYPAASDHLNRELLPLLIYLDAPDVIAKTLALLDQATTQEQQVHYVYNLRNVKSGWTMAQREKYFSWFAQAIPGGASSVLTNQAPPSRLHPPGLVQWFKDVDRDYSDGASYSKYLVKIRQDALATLTGDEREELGSLVNDSLEKTPWKQARERKFVRQWTVDDVAPALEGVAHGRDFKSGKAAFNDAQCIVCHRFGNAGGSVGPELTGASSKYSRQSLLESIIEPSKVISDQFQSTTIFKKDGDNVSGRIIAENKERVIVMPSMLNPEKTVTVPVDEIVSRQVSKVSAMPAGLVNQLTQEEILDLLAYMEAMGKAKAKNFQP